MDKKVSGTIPFDIWVNVRKLADLSGKSQDETVATLIRAALPEALRQAEEKKEVPHAG